MRAFVMLREGKRNEKASIQRQSDHGDLNQAESGVPVSDFFQELGMSSGLFYQWHYQWR